MLFGRRFVASSLQRPHNSIGKHSHVLRCCFSSGGGVPVDIEHFSSGWTTSTISDSTKQQQQLQHQQGDSKYIVQTFNKISPSGLTAFPSKLYTVQDGTKQTNEDDAQPAQLLLLRSHQVDMDADVAPSVRAIARCGAGTNNIPVARCTELGIPVFNTPGANANSVKELILAALLLGSRRITDGITHMRQLGAQGLARERVEKDKAKFGGREIKGKTLAVIGLGHIGSATARDATSLGMKVQGYDPGLSVQSALSLPRDMMLTDSIASAVATADYISINIPYVKKLPEAGGTHGIIGSDVIAHFKQDAVLVNFARGELVDSNALKSFLDNNTARYITDFPEDVLWDHPSVIVIPHLGASTTEAEDTAARMAAETLREYTEHGTIRHSVNFPTTVMPERHENIIRITVVNHNKPGMLSKITDCCAKAGVNIAQHMNQSRGAIAYNVMDITTISSETLSLKQLQRDMTMLDGVLSTRILFGTPGTGYARNIDGTYFV